tara:strand:- start:225 stop:1112 length:888 start_codon:yes stop_codon:yes gene_type:complete
LYQKNIQIPSISFTNKSFCKLIYVSPICRFLSKLLSPFGLDISFCRYQSRITIYSKKKDFLLYENLPKGYFINLGAGGFRHTKWINYDYPAITKYYKKLIGKVNKNYIPIDLNSDLKAIREKEIVGCYLSHILEHLPRESGSNLLNFIYQRLVPGGVIRVVVPDHETLFINKKTNKSPSSEEEIIQSIIDLFEQAKELNKQEIIEIFKHSESCDELYQKLILKWPHLKETVKNHPEYHLSLWSRKFINEVSNRLGFDRCYVTTKNCSTLKPFTNYAVFDTTEDHKSLYFEICKNV